jgi:hypothetical protein
MAPGAVKKAICLLIPKARCDVMKSLSKKEKKKFSLFVEAKVLC